MSRKVRKTRASERLADDSPRLAGLGPLVPIAAVVGIAFFAVLVLEMLRGHVMQAAEYNPALILKLEYTAGSEWVEREEWLPRIAAAVELPEQGRLKNSELLAAVADRIRATGWVRHVYRVSRTMDGTIRACCDYRRPIAMLLTNKGRYIPIDEEGVRLPEEYDKVDTTSGWMRILGVQADAPPVGHAYGEVGDRHTDAIAAVKLAALLFRQDEIASRISGIDVTNFNGREDKFKTHIKLWTRDGRMIKWGSAIGQEVEEPAPADKLRNILAWLKRGSPQAYAADVSVYRNGVVIPASAP